jgi:copper(I)-binding protein
VSIHCTSITETGVARMWPMAVLAVDADTTLRLEPGGLHVMFNALKAPLVAGQKVPLTMKFDGGEPEFTLMLEVRPLTAAADGRTDH